MARNGVRVSAFACAILAAVLVAGCGGGGGAAPTVLSSNATGDRLYPTTPISVTFSTAMDEASVEEAFEITGSGPVEGAFAWTEATVTFTPSALWKTHHPYTLTIGTGAKDAGGSAIAEAYTQSFRTNINMHDVNADGIDDLLAGAPENDESGSKSGMAYLFLGRESWANIDLATQTADAQYNIEGGADAMFGYFASIIGDVNGDGYADMAVSAPPLDLDGTDRGAVIIIYGSDSPTSRTFRQTDTDVDVLAGAVDDTELGAGVYPAGDVNGDGLADFFVGGRFPPADFKFWLVLGKTTAYGFMQPITSVAAATYIVSGNFGPGVQMFDSCDVNGEVLDDFLFGAPSTAGGGIDRGMAYLVVGSENPSDIDLRTDPATATFTGGADNDRLAFNFVPGCDDINADGYDDLLMCAPTAAGTKGACYLVLGSASPASLNFGTDSASATFTGDAAAAAMGFGLSTPGDINDDGYPDMIFGAPMKNVGGAANTGEAWLFLGSASPESIDLSAGGAADATYIGQRPPVGDATGFGISRPFGDINGDGIADMVFNSIQGPDGTARGVIQIVFGSATPASVDFDTQEGDAAITGHADGDVLLLYPML